MINHKGLVDRQRYHIRVEGLLPKSWYSHMEASKIKIEYDQGNRPITNLLINVVDQAALRGILVTLWDLNLNLVSINRMEDLLEGDGGCKDENDN